MRFLVNGPDIPDELVALQERGEVIFICGAGISRAIGLPDFRQLVEVIYRDLGENWENYPAENEVMRDGGLLAHQYDRCLRSLEKRLAASDIPKNKGMRERLRAVICKALTPPYQADLKNHLALLELSRDSEGQNRLLTTNFDTLFERAWFERYGTVTPSHAGAAMPSPKTSGFRGVLHLHGRLADISLGASLSETDLVLTSSEFGDAYLRSGWASRYVYDVVRACTVVLVGYSADDPPMRYLLEVLEADRERYRDIHRVYAFAASGADESLSAALWRAKGIEPILYHLQGSNHCALYETLHKWNEYAADPTSWRRNELLSIFSRSPKELSQAELARCAALLRHGDASKLLGELSPSADWLPPLIDRRVFSAKGAHAGPWIVARLDDAEMIKESVSLPYFGAEAAWLIERELDRNREKLSSTRLRSWSLILRAKRDQPARKFEDGWHVLSKKIRQGDVGYHIRQTIKELLQPHLVVAKKFRLSGHTLKSGTEALSDLLRIDFESVNDCSPEEVLQCWPEELEHEIGLFRVLDRALIDALEEAQDVGFVDGWDRASADVPSIEEHSQNSIHAGFYPIVRVLSVLWRRIASRDRENARSLVSGWAKSPFLIYRRLNLFAHSFETVFSIEEAWQCLSGLTDDDFWRGQAQVEVMRLAVLRWREYTPEQRDSFEARICKGVPREMFREEAYEREGEWETVHDVATMKRLNRIKSAGWSLTDESERLLQAFLDKHPRWLPGEGDRDDFAVWHESYSGPQGKPTLLKNTADEILVSEAMRLKRENEWEQGDIWQMFCAADPERALVGLRSEANAARWDVDAWNEFLWAAMDKSDEALQRKVATEILIIPDEALALILSPACRWLEKWRHLFTSRARPSLCWVVLVQLRLLRSFRSPYRRLVSLNEVDFAMLWDRLAALAFPVDAPEPIDIGDAYDRALNDPAGELANALVCSIGDRQPKEGGGFTKGEASRMLRITGSNGDPHFLARATLCRFLAFLESIDPDWVASNLLKFLSWSYPDAASMWSARAYDGIGSERLFNALKEAMLEAFGRPGISDVALENLLAQLMGVSLQHRKQKMEGYSLSTAEIRRALAVAPDQVRTTAAWQLWQMMADVNLEPLGRGSRWRELIGPFFREIWPLDVSLRNEAVSRNLVFMALECDDAFPDAVAAVKDCILPYQLYQIAYSLRGEDAYAATIKRFPRAALQLVNSLIDPSKFPLPNDLSEFLQSCVDEDTSVQFDSEYIRLFGLRRQSAS